MFSEHKKGILLHNFFERRNEIEKLLWIRHDPDNRAKAVQEWMGIKSDIELLNVYVLMKDGTIMDPNLALMKENGQWTVFRED
ncbi:hypothetical protein EV294_102822 [Paenibacillus sp. BK033]|nr:hypothetical protein EV294_102822 [Paenibacillus sp. BK033]